VVQNLWSNREDKNSTEMKSTIRIEFADGKELVAVGEHAELDTVQWVELPTPPWYRHWRCPELWPPVEAVIIMCRRVVQEPVATHKALLIDGLSPVWIYKLSDGTCVITAKDVAAFLGSNKEEQ
jgi:hypothetical protein